MTEPEIYRTVVRAIKSIYPQHKWMRRDALIKHLDIKSATTFYEWAKDIGATKHVIDGVVLWDAFEFDAYVEAHAVKE